MLPNLSDYMQTFQNPSLFLSDRELVSCTCPKDQQGQPKVQSGGFALTFRLESPTKKWAVRCFHREVKDRDKRYTAISSKLNEPAIKHSGYFVDFAYQAAGVTVKGRRFPIVKMSWAQGATLGAFLETNYNNPQRLRNLKSSLRQLYKFLAMNHIAHGDIQPGNLMVSADGCKVQLIDYDGMFVPGMEVLNAAETGVPNFQHPGRQKLCPWNDRLDRFPFIMLDIALSVLEEKPSYWTKTNSSDEKVLFETTDYIAPYGSQTFNDLKADARFSKQISVLQQICLSDFDDIPDAADYISFKPSSSLHKKAQQPKTILVSYQGNYKVLDATCVGSIALHVGDVVEIIGRVFDTKDGVTSGRGRHGSRPYMFVNFTQWRPRVDTFRLVLWSEVLAQFAHMSVHSVSGRLSGQYVSIVGMINVYANQFGTTYQLVPSAAKQIQIIDKTEADYRLGKIKKQLKQSFGGTMSAPAPQTLKNSNAEKLQTIVGGGSSSRISARRPTRVLVPTSRRPQMGSLPIPSSNAAKLKKMQGQWDGSASSRSRSPASSRTSGTPMAGTSNGGGCCLWLVGVIFLIVLLGSLC